MLTERLILATVYDITLFLASSSELLYPYAGKAAPKPHKERLSSESVKIS